MISQTRSYDSFVMNLNDYSEEASEDKIRNKIFGDANYSLIVSGRTGSGKDAILMSIMDIDLQEKRTVVVFDSKMEYPSCVFMQRDPALKDILLSRGIPPASYNINLWIPYTEGLYNDKHFQALLKYGKHPKLKIRPFRIMFADIESHDTKTFALGLSELQSLESEGMSSKLVGQSARLKEFREEAASKIMIFDKEDRSYAGCGWEYIDFGELTNNKEVNVFSFYFMLRENTTVAIHTVIGLLNELLSRGMGHREENEIFTIYVPELQLLMPKGVKKIEQGANMLKFRMTIGLLLMRSFHTRMRINLQNLSRLDPDMFSQVNLYIGRTTNPKDLNLLMRYYGFAKKNLNKISHLPIGHFVDIQRRGNNKIFTVAPRSHKALEREHFLTQIKKFYNNPEDFLYDTDVVSVTDLNDIVKDGINITIDQYHKKVRDWIDKQPMQTIKPLQQPKKEDKLAELREMLEMGA